MNSPAAARHFYPEELLGRSPARMVVKGGSALIEAARVPRVFELETLIVQVVAKLVAEGAQESSEGSHLLTDSRTHPNPDLQGFRRIVSK
jgi:hypothetical protein